MLDHDGGPPERSNHLRLLGLLARRGEADPPRRGSLTVARERTTLMNKMRPLDPTVWRWLIHHGMTVYAAGGGLVGTVTEVGATYLTVERHCVVTTVSYSAIASVGRRAVHLNIAMDEVVHQD